MNLIDVPAVSLTTIGLPRITGLYPPTNFGFCNFHIITCAGSMALVPDKRAKIVAVKMATETALLKLY